MMWVHGGVNTRGEIDSRNGIRLMKQIVEMARARSRVYGRKDAISSALSWSRVRASTVPIITRSDETKERKTAVLAVT